MERSPRKKANKVELISLGPAAFEFGANSPGKIMERRKQTKEPGSRQNESAFEISKYMDRDIIIEISSGRTLRGVLKGYDYISNVVLDNTVEIDVSSGNTRKMGLIVVKGSQITAVHPAQDFTEISNPFE